MENISRPDWPTGMTSGRWPVLTGPPYISVGKFVKLILELLEVFAEDVEFKVCAHGFAWAGRILAKKSPLKIRL